MSAGTYSDPLAVIGNLHAYNAAAVTAALPLLAWTAPFQCRIGGIQANGATAGTGGGSTVLDITINGTSVWVTTANRPTLLAVSTGNFALLAPDSRTIKRGDQVVMLVLTISTTGHALLNFSLTLERST